MPLLLVFACTNVRIAYTSPIHPSLDYLALLKRGHEPPGGRARSLGIQVRITENYPYLMAGFPKEKLRARYDVGAFSEDPWHAYCGERTSMIVIRALREATTSSRMLLNAGAGVYKISNKGWQEVAVDLFEAPLSGRPGSICANIEDLPLSSASFGAVVCVGEVIGYCDPQRAIAEFGRLLEPGGVLVCDFESTLSFRHRFRPIYGREADIIVDEYNGSDEQVWAYSPGFIRRQLEHAGFDIRKEFGTHTWSAIAARFGVAKTKATALQRKLTWMPSLERWADVKTIVAVRRGALKG